MALLAASVLFLALVLFGARFHWVEEAGTAERDGYAAQADQLLAGHLPHDPYRPLLYPLLAAGVKPLAGDSFTAARLLSNLAAAALAWLAWATGRRLAGPATGAWAMALAAVNPNLWIIGQHATTDMMFGALAAGCLLAALGYLQAPSAGRAIACGALLGLAIFTRANAVVLIPALLLAWALAIWSRRSLREPAAGGFAAAAGAFSEPPVAAARVSTLPVTVPGSRWVDLGLAALAAIIALLPHWILRSIEFGNPFYDENWKNLAFKLYGYPDWSYLDRVPFHSLGEIVRADPGAVARGTVSEMARFAASGAAQLFGTWAQVALIAAGTLWALWQPATRRASAWLVVALGSFLLITATVFFTWGRLLLLLIPGAYALAFAPWGVLKGRAGRHPVALALHGVAALLVLLLAVKTFAYRLPAFAERHPYTEVAALRQLDATLPAGSVLAGSSPFLGRYLQHHRYVDLPDAFGQELGQPDLYYAKLQRLVRQEGIGWLVVGPVDLRSRPAGLVGRGAYPSWLAPAGERRGVRVWKVIDWKGGEERPQRPAG